MKKKIKGEKRSYRRKNYQAPRGMRDVFATEWYWFDKFLTSAKKISEFYGFQRIETPILENAAIFDKGVGSETEMIAKQMYTLKTKEEGEMLALRPEGTAAVARAYIEQSMFNQPQPVKLYYFGPFFRHEKPQSGRFRQFYQFGLEIIGEGDAANDVEIILVTKLILENIGLKGIHFKINSIGCLDCRPVYIRLLKKHFRSRMNNLCSDCRRRLNFNPLRVLDCKNEKCFLLTNNAPSAVDYLCENCHNHFKEVLEILDYLNIFYSLDNRLVRGIDYYTKTVFEVFADSEKKSLALGGGGRYDGLIKLLGGLERPAVGVALGVERIIEILKEGSKEEKIFAVPKVFLAQLGDLAKKESFRLLEKLRKENIFTVASLGKDSLKAQLKNADRLKVKYALILGQKETLDGMIILRDMNSGIQELVSLEKIVEVLKKQLKLSD